MELEESPFTERDLKMKISLISIVGQEFYQWQMLDQELTAHNSFYVSINSHPPPTTNISHLIPPEGTVKVEVPPLNIIYLSVEFAI